MLSSKLSTQQLCTLNSLVSQFCFFDPYRLFVCSRIVYPPSSFENSKSQTGINPPFKNVEFNLLHFKIKKEKFNSDDLKQYRRDGEQKRMVSTMYYFYAYSIHRENMCGTDMPIVQWSILCQRLCKTGLTWPIPLRLVIYCRNSDSISKVPTPIQHCSIEFVT